MVAVGSGSFAALVRAVTDLFIKGHTEELMEAERLALGTDAELLAKVESVAEQLEELRAEQPLRAVV